MPTETVYGLAANATDATAVLKIFEAKGRPRFDPLIVHCSDVAHAQTVAVFTDRALALARAYWPGPMTLVLQRRECIPDAVTSGLSTVAVRVPDHPVAQALIRASGLPLAAPSANRFGRMSPTTAAHVREQLGDALLVLEGGPCRVGVESTVLRPDPAPALVLRPGGVSREMVALVLGDVSMADTKARADNLPRDAPGMLASHYAPRKPLRLRVPGTPWPEEPAVALLGFTGADFPSGGGPRVALSATGSTMEAAANLFARMRVLDAFPDVREIVAELVPDTGIGEAVNDRLRRAAGLG
eukprot:TRINITY_DN8428_c0_g1_i1.p2 TRINITY_DN8428_c0_g1~~TRINITY_DN8428_c0_g1_i1.p2  ORF type:complete len:334 (+),score=94.07 TRINITY_DN8428_c0_g1_i1:106-1002(+)